MSSPCIESMQLGTHQECAGNSSRVSGACRDRAKEFARRRLRLAGRLSGVAEKLTGRDSPKGSGSLLGTHREITGEKTIRLAASMPEVIGLAEVRL
ncbi:hypothetical protein BHE74_00048365 [Ensete ventricosum]|nr:hypothetical protein BHE74_00048365 [Ensete ventricosum]